MRAEIVAYNLEFPSAFAEAQVNHEFSREG